MSSILIVIFLPPTAIVISGASCLTLFFGAQQLPFFGATVFFGGQHDFFESFFGGQHDIFVSFFGGQHDIFVLFLLSQHLFVLVDGLQQVQPS